MWLFGAVGTRNPVGLVAAVFPKFIAHDGQERAHGGRQGNKRRVGAARRRRRGHGPARLDGTRPRATVADKVMKSGETAGHGNGHAYVLTERQAKRAGPKLEAGPEASAMWKAGDSQSRQG